MRLVHRPFQHGDDTRRRFVASGVASFLVAWVLAQAPGVHAGVITGVATDRRIVALTFDACETKTPSFFDEKILSYLLSEKIPFTVFVGGKFADRNRARLREIAGCDFVEIENHSMNHILHMEKLREDDIAREVRDAERMIEDITGYRTRYFRFPGGNCDERSRAVVERLGYAVVHWTVAAGDSDKSQTPGDLARRVLLRTKPGAILIFHINGRGYATGEALPGIVDALRKRHFTFMKLSDFLSE